MAIEITGVSKNFGDVRALTDVTLHFGEERIYGLLGNNGAGKSTLLACLTNREFPSAGSITIDGVDVASSDEARGKLFLVGEKNLFPVEMKVRQALRFAAACYPNFDMAYAEALAEKFKLNPKKKIASLSTGFASIFRLVLALSAGTPYLLLDEPVLGLDAQNRDLFYRLLLEHYAKKPCTIVISTHLIEEIAGVIEQAVIIREGKILKNAPVEELLADACTISGPAAAVDAFLAGKRVLSMRNLGGLKSACVQGAAEAALPAGLERTALHLQEYFISLMQEEDR